MARSPGAVLSAAWPAFLRVPPRARMLPLLGGIALLAGLNQALFHDIIVLLREARNLLNEDLGVAGKASGVAYLVTLPLGGVFAHMLGPRRVLLGAGILIAIAGFGMGFVFDARGYALLCLVLGLAAGLIPGAAVTAIGFWFAPQEQARAIAGLLAAPVLGGLIATLLMSNRTEQWTGHRLSDYWQTIYLGSGCWQSAGASSPKSSIVRGPRFGGRPPISGVTDLPVGTLWPLGVILRGGVLLLLAFCQAYALCLGGGWLDARLFDQWHLSIGAIEFVVLAGLIGKIGGVLLGGFLSDMAFHHSGNVKSARQVVIGLGFLLGALALLPLLHLHDATAGGIWRGASVLLSSR